MSDETTDNSSGQPEHAARNPMETPQPYENNGADRPLPNGWRAERGAHARWRDVPSAAARGPDALPAPRRRNALRPGQPTLEARRTVSLYETPEGRSARGFRSGA